MSNQVFSPARLSRIYASAEFLDEPAPSLVRDLISEIDRLNSLVAANAAEALVDAYAAEANEWHRKCIRIALYVSEALDPMSKIRADIMDIINGRLVVDCVDDFEALRKDDDD